MKCRCQAAPTMTLAWTWNDGDRRAFIAWGCATCGSMAIEDVWGALTVRWIGAPLPIRQAGADGRPAAGPAALQPPTPHQRKRP